MILREKLNGLSRFIPLYIFIFTQILISIWWAAGQNEKVRIIEEEKIPQIRENIINVINRQYVLDKELTNLLRDIRDTLLIIRMENNHIMSEMSYLRKNIELRNKYFNK